MKRSRPERELTDDERKLVIAVRHCARELDDILQGARRKAQSNATLFANSGISFMFRGVDSYADMYEKLDVKSREALEKLFIKFSDCEEVNDTQDAIEETEGNWKTFLNNLDKEIIHGQTKNSDNIEVESDSFKEKCDYLYFSQISLIDCQTNREFDFSNFIRAHTCVFISCQPAFWPDTNIRYRHSEISRIQCDLSQFNVGYLIVTWGPFEEVRTWAKQIARLTKWPVLYDRSGEFRNHFDFKYGLHRIWAAENLDFLGCQRAIFNHPVRPPPTDINWLEWRQIGGELILARPVNWDPKLVNPAVFESQKVSTLNSGNSDDRQELNLICEVYGSQAVTNLSHEALLDKDALQNNKLKICAVHASSNLADLMPSGSVYQAALTCYARMHNITEASVMDKIRRDRRFSTAPESARLQYEPSSGLYYDPETSLYYDSASGYFYDAINRMYYYWSQSDNRYVEANTIIQANLASTQAERAAMLAATAAQRVIERQAAHQAAMQVAAEIAEIRASKNDYASYAYATCVLPQSDFNVSHKELPSYDSSQSTYRSTTASVNQIESSLKAWDNCVQIPFLSHESHTRNIHNTTPPPPGL